MSLILRQVSITVLALFVVGSVQSRPLPAVPQAAVQELGVEYGIPRMSGFVFIDGRYIPPPYTVTRRGNGIFINRIQIEQPVAWSYFDPDSAEEPADDPENPADDTQIQDVNGAASAQMAAEADASGTKQVSSFDDLFGDEDAGKQKKEPVQSKTISSIDDLFGDDSDGAQGVEMKKKEKPETISSIDDLFGDNDEDAAPAPVAEKKVGEVASLDDLFSDEDASRKTPAQNNAGNAPIVVRAPVELTEAQIAERKEILKKSLNEQRAFYERALAKGELYFFGTMHHKINGTYGTARALFEVLPTALRYARSPNELQRRLEDGGVYFVDILVCQALYRHKTTFPLIQQRLEKIRLQESVKEANRKKY